MQLVHPVCIDIAASLSFAQLGLLRLSSTQFVVVSVVVVVHVAVQMTLKCHA